MYKALPTEKYLFISHNSADKDQVIRIQKHIENHALSEKHGLKVWLDIDDIHNNTGFQKQILETIRDKVCAFAVYRTNNEVTTWMHREIDIAHSRYMEGQKNEECFPLILCLPKTTSEKISTSVLIDDFNYIQNIDAPDSITRLITEALCLNDSNVQASTQTQIAESAPPTNNLHTIIYRLTQQNGTAYMQNNLDDSREHDASRLQIDKFGDIPIQEMSSFLFGSQTDWQMLNQQLAETNPKRIRIMSDDPQLALLPWQHLKAPDNKEYLIESGWKIEQSPVFKDTNHLQNNESQPIQNPLIVMPVEIGEFNTSTYRNQIQEHIHQNLDFVGNLDFRETVFGFKNYLEIDPPDLIYLFAEIENGQIKLEPDPYNDKYTITIDELSEQLAQAVDKDEKPIVILHLFGSGKLKDYPEKLINSCSLLCIQQQSSRPDQLLGSFLEIIESLQNKEDITQLLAKQSLSAPADQTPHIWLSHNTPKISTKHDKLTIGQLRAALLRVTLGRKTLKDQFFGALYKNQNFDQQLCMFSVIGGSQDASPCIFPAQLRQRLQWEDRETAIHVVNCDITLQLDPDSNLREIRDDIRNANDKYIGHHNIADMLDSRTRPNNQSSVIMFNWYLEQGELEEEQLENIVEALAWLIKEEFAPATPDNAVMLCLLCLQTETEENAEEALETMNLALADIAYPNVNSLPIESPLGRLKQLELRQFLSPNSNWRELLHLNRYKIDSKAFVKWIMQDTNGHFENTVTTLWQQYKHHYKEYQDS